MALDANGALPPALEGGKSGRPFWGTTDFFGVEEETLFFLLLFSLLAFSSPRFAGTITAITIKSLSKE